MIGKKKDRTQRISEGAVIRRLAMIGIAGLIAVLLLILVDTISHDNYISWNDNVKSKVTYADGSISQSNSNIFGLVDKGDEVTIDVELPANQKINGGVLCFYAYHSIIHVYYGDELLYSYGQNIDSRGDMIGAVYPQVNIPEKAWGKKLTITLDVRENDALTKINEFRVYEKNTAYQYFIDLSPVGLAVSAIGTLAGLLAILIILFLGNLDITARRGLYISVFAILLSAWIFSSFGMYNLFAFSYIWAWFEFLSLYLLPIPLLLYIYEAENLLKSRKLLSLVLGVNIIFNLVTTVLHFTNICHYSNVLIYAHIMIFMDVCVILICCVLGIKRGDRSARRLLTGVILMAVVALIDLMRFNIGKYLGLFDRLGLVSILPLGMMFFLVFFVLAFYEDILSEKAKAVKIQLDFEAIQRTLKSIPAGICVLEITEEAKIIEANDFYYKIFGYTKEEAIEMGFDNVFFRIKDDEKPWILEQCKEFIASKSKYEQLEIKATDKFGKEISLQYRAFFDLDTERTITINVVDVTERNAMEDQLRINEESYKLALSQSGKMFFYFDIADRTAHLSEELSELFDLPQEVRNIHEVMIKNGFVSDTSAEDFRKLYQQIFDGISSGSELINVKMPNGDNNFVLFNVMFNSIFDSTGKPSVAIVTCEDYTEWHEKEIESEWKQINLLNIEEREYVITDYNMTTGEFKRQVGGLFVKLPTFITKYEEIHSYVIDNFVYSDDVDALINFLDRKRLLGLYESGIVEDNIEYRSVQSGSSYRWTSITAQLIKDPYSEDILGRFLIKDIEKQKGKEIRIRRDINELKKELENSRIKVMINQMQPHFLYNALSAIRTITKHDPERAYSLLYDFTVHLRSSIKALSGDEYIPFADELKNIKAYLNIEKMRFGDALNVEYQIDCDDFKVVPLSVQPLAENAARHGIYPKNDEGGGTIKISAYETEDYYIIEVTDDGVGFDIDTVLGSKSDSVGLKSLIFRLKSLMDADVDITSELGKGTKATIRIPKERGVEDENDYC